MPLPLFRCTFCKFDVILSTLNVFGIIGAGAGVETFTVGGAGGLAIIGAD